MDVRINTSNHPWMSYWPTAYIEDEAEAEGEAISRGIPG
jgi:hypothetical protein